MAVTQKSVNIKYSVVLTGMFKFQNVSQFVERQHSEVSCVLSNEDLIWYNFSASYNRGSFPREQNGWGVKLTIHLHLVPRSIMVGLTFPDTSS
jgi:hypothetical protein